MSESSFGKSHWSEERGNISAYVLSRPHVIFEWFRCLKHDGQRRYNKKKGHYSRSINPNCSLLIVSKCVYRSYDAPQTHQRSSTTPIWRSFLEPDTDFLIPYRSATHILGIFFFLTLRCAFYARNNLPLTGTFWVKYFPYLHIFW